MIKLVGGPLDGHTVECAETMLVVRDNDTGNKHIYEIGPNAYFQGDVREETK